MDKWEAVWTVLSTACTIIITLGGAGAIIVAVYRWMHKPTDSRDETIKRHTDLLDKDNKRLHALEDWKTEQDASEKILMKSLLALMSHALDGNHTNELKKARDDLQEYIIGR